MRAAVVGGRLQGAEAAYLAGKAGWEVLLIDKDQFVPAAGLCDSFCQLDVIRVAELMRVLKDVDLIIPALENMEALGVLGRCAKYLNVPIIFDAGAYDVSSSKIKSNELFSRIGVPAPLSWPRCGFPMIAKPSGSSGSEGVIRIRSQQEFQCLADKLRPQADWVMEEYLEGPSFSIEVMGFAGNYKVLQVTELQMDDIYDCKRVLAPVSLDPGLKKQFDHTALSIARSLNLNGIMDVETILHNGVLKVLEIDARLPSQTPTAVYKSTGINMLELIGEAFVQGKAWPEFEMEESRGVVYEHIRASAGRIEVSGEHIMAGAGPLHLCRDFFGADEAVTNYAPGKSQWVATLIITGSSHQAAWEKRCDVIRRIRVETGTIEYFDPFPAYTDQSDMIKEVYKCYDEIA